MWPYRSCLLLVLCCFGMFAYGCRGEIGKTSLEMTPNRGCAPLTVTLRGKADVRSEAPSTLHWTVGKSTQLKGSPVVHTFEHPGTYDITLTVTVEQFTKTRTATIQIGEAEPPNVPGVYVQQGCAYVVLKPVAEHTKVTSFGKTSLEDLQQRIVGRALSTRELVTHPLWRREHTHTVYLVERDQFIDLPVTLFQTRGFVVFGEADTTEVALFKIVPEAESAPGQSQHIVTRVVDSWGLQSVHPEPQALSRTPQAPNLQRYVPEGNLPEGLYVIDVKSADQTMSGLRPIALVIPNNS